MIDLYLDNHRVFFVGTNEIKMTAQNPYVTSSGTYSLEVEIPLDIPENLELFGSIQRIEIGKNARSFSARILAKNKEIFNGSATITSVNNSSVKVQLLGGNSDYNRIVGGKDVYIDELSYEELNLSEIAEENGAEARQLPPEDFPYYNLVLQLAPKHYAQLLSYDSGHDIWLNGDNEPISISPNFLFVIRAVIAALGYRLDSCDMDDTPIHNLFVASGGQVESNWDMATILKKSLPHWTIQEFFEEVQNLMNCTVKFKETSKTVDIIRNSSETTSKTELDVIDEYTVEIDESKRLQTPSTSNVCYGCSDEEGWDLQMIPSSVHDNFEHKIFNTITELQNFVRHNPGTAKYLLLHSPEATAIYENTVDEIRYIDLYGMRYVGSSEKKELKICPALAKAIDSPDENEDMGYLRFVVSGPNPLVAGVNVRPVDVLYAQEEDYSSYSSKADSKSDEMRLQTVTGWDGYQMLNYVMSLKTHSDIYSRAVPAPTMTIGDLFTNALEIKDTILHRFSFVAEEVPNVSNIFLIRNKKYICKKIDYTMKDDGIKPLMTGEFYEIS